MAPDINSMPASPRLGRASQSGSQPPSVNASRRTSHVMGPPPPPAPPIVATNTSNTTGNPGPNTQRSPIMSTNDQSGLPLRHPRPLTAAELYLECEKEQEAVVNRLTRELTALRAQSASVASNASHSSTSTSASLLPVDITDPNPTHQMIGSTHPTPSRRHRSSSSVSNRSWQNPSANGAPTGAGVNTTTSHAPAGTVPLGSGVSQASADRAAAAGGGASSLSRQPSASALGGSSASASARASLDLARHPHRPSMSREPSLSSSTAAHAGSSSALPSPSLHLGTSVASARQHYADTAAYRSEMEIVRAENEALRQRVRALERALRSQQQQQQSTPAQQQQHGSTSTGGGRRRRDSSQSDFSARQAARGEALEGLVTAAPPARGSPAAALSPSGPALSPSVSAGGVSGVAAWAANDGGIGGVAGPRERSESQSTTASSRRGLGAAVDDEVRFGESASSVGLGRGA